MFRNSREEIFRCDHADKPISPEIPANYVDASSHLLRQKGKESRYGPGIQRSIFVAQGRLRRRDCNILPDSFRWTDVTECIRLDDLRNYQRQRCEDASSGSGEKLVALDIHSGDKTNSKSFALYEVGVVDKEA